MIDLIDLDLSIKEKMDEIRSKTGNNHINAKTFLSSYIWGKPMGIKVHLEDDMFAIRNSSHGPTVWNFPVGSERPKIEFIRKLIHIKGLKFRLLTEDDVNFVSKHFPDLFICEEAADESEYVYDAIEHAQMSGKRFRNLGKQVKRFYSQHDTKSVMLTKGNLQVADNIMVLWAEAHEGRSDLNTSGIEIGRFLIDNYDKLGLIGILTYVDGTPSAVSIGYSIASDMCDIAETKFVPTIKNLGYIVVEEFMKVFGDKYRYFNSEEDMGIPGLREYKRCLKPCRMNILCNAYLK